MNQLNAPTLQCSDCASDSVFAVRPGRAPEYSGGDGRYTGRILLRRGVPDRLWCAACWPALRPIAEVVRPIVARALARRQQP